MSGRSSRVARKAARVDRSEVEQEFDREIAALRRVRDEAFRGVNVSRDTAIAHARAEAIKTKRELEREFEVARAKLLKRLAGKEAVAA